MTQGLEAFVDLDVGAVLAMQAEFDAANGAAPTDLVQ
jgi:hypothetical protein